MIISYKPLTAMRSADKGPKGPKLPEGASFTIPVKHTLEYNKAEREYNAWLFAGVVGSSGVMQCVSAFGGLSDVNISQCYKLHNLLLSTTVSCINCSTALRAISFAITF